VQKKKREKGRNPCKPGSFGAEKRKKKKRRGKEPRLHVNTLLNFSLFTRKGKEKEEERGGKKGRIPAQSISPSAPITKEGRGGKRKRRTGSLPVAPGFQTEQGREKGRGGDARPGLGCGGTIFPRWGEGGKRGGGGGGTSPSLQAKGKEKWRGPTFMSHKERKKGERKKSLLPLHMHSRHKKKKKEKKKKKKILLLSLHHLQIIGKREKKKEKATGSSSPFVGKGTTRGNSGGGGWVDLFALISDEKKKNR